MDVGSALKRLDRLRAKTPSLFTAGLAGIYRVRLSGYGARKARP